MSLAKMTRGERVIEFIHRYCMAPEGDKVSQPIRLLPFQREFILAVYDNPNGTSRAYLSMARKNGKTALIACLVLAHVAGPEAVKNSQIISGAKSRDQAALVFNLAEKMVNLNPKLQKVIRITPSRKMLTGLTMNVEYKAISAEAGTAHGLSPVVAILDEVGQVKGSTDRFIEAIDTAQGAYDSALLLAISTQASTDADMFSLWLDAAASSRNPHIVSRLYAAPEDCNLMDRTAWEAANPALGAFRSLPELERKAVEAIEMPSAESSFRWLYLNQRVNADAPFISKSVWKSCAGAVVPSFDGLPVFAGLDLSTVQDLTAFVAVAPVDGIWHVRPTFWLPAYGLAEKSKADHTSYDRWERLGYLKTTPGKSIDYRFLAAFLWDFCSTHDVRKIAFDRYKYEFLKPLLAENGFTEDQLDGDNAIFEQFGQGFKSMAPALHSLEADFLEQRIAHGDHPVLEMCAQNATVTMDDAGNRKFSKSRSHGRIDGMVALAMAMSAAGTWEAVPPIDVRAMIM